MHSLSMEFIYYIFRRYYECDFNVLLSFARLLYFILISGDVEIFVRTPNVMGIIINPLKSWSIQWSTLNQGFAKQFFPLLGI
jgi:hypothetical protein